MADKPFDPTLVRPLHASNVSRGILAVAAEIGDFVRVDANDEFELADASSAAGVAGNIGMIVGANMATFKKDGVLAQGDKVTILWQGRVETGRTDLDTALALFVSDATAGKAADAAGANVRQVGAPISKSQIYFDGIA